MPKHRLARIVGTAVVACWLVATGARAEGAATELVLVSDSWPPFTGRHDARRVAIALVHEALARIGVRAESRIRPDLASLIEDARAGTIDGSAALWRNADRERVLRFSRPYLENRLVLVGRKGNGPGDRPLGALGESRVGLVEGYAYGPAVEQAAGITRVFGPSDQENLNRLLRGDVDFILVDALIAHEIFEQHGERADLLLERGGATIASRPLHLALRRDLSDVEDLLSRFDEAIREMLADGTYNRLLGLRWVSADLDGDGRVELILGGKHAGTVERRVGYPVFEPAPRDAGDAATAQLPPPRFVVDGRTYDHWRNIPENYRVPAEPGNPEPGPGLLILEF